MNCIPFSYKIFQAKNNLIGMEKQIASSFKILKKHKTVGEDIPVLQINQPVEFLMKVLKHQQSAQYQQRQISSLTEQKGVSKHQAVLGHDTLKNSLEKIILEMRVGQIWQVQNCYQARQNQDHLLKKQIQPQSDGQQQIKTQNHLLIEIKSSKQPVGAKKSPLQQAKQLKDIGNASVKSKQYAKAKQTYKEAFKMIQFNSSKQAEEIKLSLISNLSLCCNHLSAYPQSIRWCNRHLNESEEPNKKIIYRKAQAQIGVKNWDQAKATIESAMKSWTDTDSQADFKGLLEHLAKEQIEQKKREKAVYGKMFN